MIEFLKQKRILLFKLFLLSGFFLILGLGVMVLWILRDLPQVDTLRPYRPSVASEVYSKEMVKIGEFYNERRFFVPLDQIPPIVSQSFISAEDSNFYAHGGVSFVAIFRAFIKNLEAGYKKQGGSTITQQVARALLLSPEKKYSRKVKEIFLAFFIEQFFSKEEILEMYLNQVYLGNSAYGVQAAGEVYYGKDLSELTIAETAMIAGLTKAPSRDNPKSNFKNAKIRQEYVLGRLFDENKITKEEFDEALQEEISIIENSDLNLAVSPYFVENIRTYLMNTYGAKKVLEDGLQVYTTIEITSALAAKEALQSGLEKIDQRQGYRGIIEHLEPNQFETFVESVQSKKARAHHPQKALIVEMDDQTGVVQLETHQGKGLMLVEHYNWARKPNPNVYWENHLIKKPSQVFSIGDVIWVKLSQSEKIPKDFEEWPIYSLYQTPEVQGALIAMDPHLGEIKALVGGYDFELSEFNRAVQSKRQPGSAFKPFIYAAALDNGYTAASIINDAPIVYDDPTNEFRWKPKNFGGDFHGDTIFRDCLVQSRNIPTIKIMQEIGIDQALLYARRFGIESKLERNFSLALGSSSVTPLEMTQAYAVFANGGKRVSPMMISKVVDRHGNILEQREILTFSEDITLQMDRIHQHRFEEQKVFQIAEIGKDPQAELPEPHVLSPQTSFIMTHLLSEVISAGTGRRALAIGRPAAGKTGTTNDNLDAWFVGFTPELVTTVWVGYDDRKPLGVREGGGSTATPVWLDFMQKALEEKPKKDFFTPPGLVYVQIDPFTGKLATDKTNNPIFEVFREGTEPTEYSNTHQQTRQTQDFFLQE